MLRTSFIKTSVFGLAVASTSLFAEATYTPNKYQQNDWFAEFGGNTSMYVNPAGISETDQLEFSAAFFSTISGEASQEYVSLTYPMDYKHTLGFSLFENGASIEGGESYGEIAAIPTDFSTCSPSVSISLSCTSTSLMKSSSLQSVLT